MHRYLQLISTTVALLLVSLPAAFAETGVACDEISWQPEVLANFEDIDKACKEVVVRDGNSYVHFEVELIRVFSNGDMKVLMRLQDGTRVERMFNESSGLRVLSHSGKTAFHVRELDKGDTLDVYIPVRWVQVAMLEQES